MENFDHNIVYEHRTDFMLGKLSDIRKRFNDMATKKQPRWRFDNDRQHWVVREATDQGFPIKGAWRIKFGANKPLLESPVQCWRAEGAPSLDLKIAYLGRATTARIFWKRLDDDKYDGKKSCGVDLNPDGKFHAYHVNLASSLNTAISSSALPSNRYLSRVRGRGWPSSRLCSRRRGSEPPRRDCLMCADEARQSH